ncbi:UNVERIFIED_CONTAM: hypothetical protein Sradi_6588600 [Sesamum radiatum]|uniref:CASP-like protein n=1 Tax=Sesamum radiatum TaxID=300843 RepID=A0AAW2JZW5_SESRA
MGFLKEDKSLNRVAFVVPRWIKTLFFLITMLILFCYSLLPFSSPSPTPSSPPPSCPPPSPLPPSICRPFLLTSATTTFATPSSISPLSPSSAPAIILCVYSFCDGPRLSRGPYLAIATVCSAASLVFVSLKASYLLMISSYSSHSKGGYVRAMEAALFVSSLGLAIGHVVVAYRTSCRERRKLLVYKIDIEANTKRNPRKELSVFFRSLSLKSMASSTRLLEILNEDRIYLTLFHKSHSLVWSLLARMDFRDIRKYSKKHEQSEKQTNLFVLTFHPKEIGSLMSNEVEELHKP